MYTYVRTSFSGPRRLVWVFRLPSFDARGPVQLRMFEWVCVYAPTWPGIPFWRYPLLGMRLEKWMGGLVGGWVEPAMLPFSKEATLTLE